MKREAYIFGYGSILSSESRNKTAGKDRADESVYPTILNGYMRCYCVEPANTESKKRHYACKQANDSSYTPSSVCFLEITKRQVERGVNGVLTQGSEAEFAKFNKREGNYELRDVTDFIERFANTSLPEGITKGTAKIYAYAPLADRIVQEGTMQEATPEEITILAEYIWTTLVGAAEFGAQFLADFIATTQWTFPHLIASGENTKGTGTNYLSIPSKLAEALKNREEDDPVALMKRHIERTGMV